MAGATQILRSVPSGRSIYDELGGAPAVADLVDALYDRLLSDEQLVGSFVSRDMARIRAPTYRSSADRGPFQVVVTGMPNGWVS